MPWVKEHRVHLGGVIAVLVAIVVVILLASSGGRDSETDANGAEIVSANSLRETAALQGVLIYWAGERNGTELELSRPSGGRTYVRYLTDGTDAGDPRPNFLTVGTYAQPDPVAALRRQSRKPGGVLAKAPGGATVYFNRAEPHSVYLAFPGVPAEVEVYDPDFETALRLVKAGRIISTG